MNHARILHVPENECTSSIQSRVHKRATKMDEVRHLLRESRELLAAARKDLEKIQRISLHRVFYGNPGKQVVVFLTV